jgi:predicted RNase H-like HicB family nuclease
MLPFIGGSLRNGFTALMERDGDWFVAWTPEIPGANGQRWSVEERRESLGAAIQWRLAGFTSPRSGGCAR